MLIDIYMAASALAPVVCLRALQQQQLSSGERGERRRKKERRERAEKPIAGAAARSQQHRGGRTKEKLEKERHTHRTFVRVCARGQAHTHTYKGEWKKSSCGESERERADSIF